MQIPNSFGKSRVPLARCIVAPAPITIERKLKAIVASSFDHCSRAGNHLETAMAILSSINVGDELRNTHLGTITVKLVVGWRFWFRMRMGVLILRLGAFIIPAHVDVAVEE